jgi:hypothetical protein
MSQIIHIFRKDVRHFWIEICASLLAVSAYVSRELVRWGNRGFSIDLPDFLNGLLTVLGPISWCLLVVRVVHDESLVGDRQFWVTRPYEWKKLLAAKALFVAAFVNLPLFLCNVVFLKKAGFSPLHYLPGLLWIQVLIVIFLVLPAANISVVTSSLVQILLWILGIAAYMAAVASLSSLIPDSGISLSRDDSDVLWALLFAAGCLGIILWQYTQRKAWIPRTVIVGIAAIITAVSLIPTPSAEIDRAYPLLAAGMQSPLRLIPIPPDHKHSVDESAIEKKKVSLSIPFHASASAGSSLVAIAATRVAIRTANGETWTSRWQSDVVEIWPAEGTVVVAPTVDRAFFERSKFSPAKVDITFAYTEYHEANVRQITVQPGKFRVDGVGNCWTETSDRWVWNAAYLECQSPLKSPQIFAHFKTSTSTCPRGETEVVPGISYVAALKRDDGTSELAIIPIRLSLLVFSVPGQTMENMHFPGICPGTPITISDPVVARTASIQIEMDDVNLSDYLVRSQNFILRQ